MPETATLPPDQAQYVPGGAVPAAIAARPVPTVAPPRVDPITVTPDTASPVQASSAAPAGSSGGRLSPEQIDQYFVAKGLTPEQARGMRRAFMGESAGDPNAYNPAGGGLGAYGIAQDRGERQRRLLLMYGPTPTAQQQLDFAWHELNTSEKPALQAVQSASTEQGAYDAFKAKFERPGPPAGEMRAGATPSFQEFTQRNQAIQDRESGAIRDLMGQAEKATPGSQERHQLMQQAIEHSDRLSHTFEELAAHPPTEKPVDAMQNFGSLATIVAMLGGLMSRRPLTAALGAAGSAMMAMNSNNHEGFERAYKTWHDQTALVGQALSFQNQEINQILADERLAEGERQDRLMNQFRIFGMQQALDQAGLGNWVEVYKMTGALQKAQVDLEKSLAQAQYYKARTAQMSGAGSGLLDKGTLSQMADQYIAGDKSVLQGLGYGNMGAANRAALRTAISQKEMDRASADFRAKNGRDPTEVEKEGLSQDIGRRLALGIAEFGGLMQAERTGYGRVAQLTMGAQEAKQFTPIAKEASAKVDRTEFPTLNKMELAVMEGTGNTDVINFVEANVALVDAYAQVIGRGNAQLTDAARSQAMGLLNTAWTKGQYDTAINAINREIDAALRAPKEMLQTFREGFAVGGQTLPDLSGHSTPPASYGSPDDVYRAFDHGEITKDQAKQILIDKFGAKPQ